MVTPESTQNTEAAQAARRLRVRNWALLAVLLGLFVIIYAVTMVRGRR